MRELKKTLWPYKITVNLSADTLDDIEIWLGKHLGVFKGRWNVVYHHNCTDFYFRQGSDATWFTLRWT